MPDRWRLSLITFIICIFIHSLVLAQEAQYQPLISGMEHYKDGRYKEALIDFQKAAVVLPDDPDVPFYIGLTYQQINEPEKAVEYFKKAIEKDPDYTDAHFQLGVGLLRPNITKPHNIAYEQVGA